MLVQLMRSSGVVVVFASLSPQLRGLLRAHGVVDRGEGGGGGGEGGSGSGSGLGSGSGSGDVVIDDLDDALEWCEVS